MGMNELESLTEHHRVIALQIARQESARPLKPYLGDDYCSMVQPDIGRGGRTGIQPLLLQADAGGGGSSRGGCLLLLPGRQSAAATKHAFSMLNADCAENRVQTRERN